MGQLGYTNRWHMLTRALTLLHKLARSRRQPHEVMRACSAEEYHAYGCKLMHVQAPAP